MIGPSKRRYTGTRLTESGAPLDQNHVSAARFEPCEEGYETSLERGKVHRLIPDAETAKHGYVRTVDQSGEHYGYPADRFIAIDLPKPLERALFSRFLAALALL